jgi:hypothetical protein
MTTNAWLSDLPLGSIYGLTILAFLLALEGGFRLGRVVQTRWPDGSQAGVGVVTGAALATLGFLLAFVTGIAMGNFNDRRHLVVDEANAITTTYLRAGYLPGPASEQSRTLLRKYVGLRIEALDRTRTVAAIASSEAVHDELWVIAEDVVREQPTATTAAYLNSLNEMIDIHTARLSSELGYRVPQVVLVGLLIVALLSLVLVGVYDSYRERHNWIALVVVAMILAMVFLLIVDLDRSNVGFVQVPQQALINLRDRLQSLP